MSVGTTSGGPDTSGTAPGDRSGAASGEESGELALRHAVLRATDRAIGMEQAAARPSGDAQAAGLAELARLEQALAETRAGLGRRDRTIAEAAERIRTLEADLARVQRAHQRAQKQADTLLASRYYRVGRSVVRPAEQAARRVKGWRAS